MLYRESGQFKRSYAADQQLFPIFQDKILLAAILVVALAIIPFVINDYWSKAILLPFMVYALVALGLNILVGYCGQISLGTGGFMAVGAYMLLQALHRLPGA